jgi:hypothetical protein
MKKSKALKKQGYKKKFKGTRYIAKVLKKYGGKKYKDYGARVEKSREIYQTLKANNQKVSVDNIESLFRKQRPSKILPIKEKPLLYYELKRDEIYYFDLINIGGLIQKTTNRITFISDLFNEDVEEVQGGEKPDYNDTFSAFVTFINKEIKEREQGYQFRIKVTEPEEVNGRWISRIISTDPSGEEDNFGYEPGVGGGIGPEPRTPIQPTKTPTKPPSKAPTSEENIAKELEIKEIQKKIDLEKQENIKLAMDLFKEGLITKLEFKELISKIG